MNQSSHSSTAHAETLMAVRDALAKVTNRATGRSIIAEGRVDGLTIDSKNIARFVIDLGDRDGAPPLSDEAAQQIVAEAKTAAGTVTGLTGVSVIATRHSGQTKNAPAPAQQPRAGGHANPLGLSSSRSQQPPSPRASGKTAPRMPGAPQRKAERIADTQNALADIGRIIAVASGKGGVGKSTVTISLAAALARRGLKVGILDADIYGPSLPTLLGLHEKPAMRDGKIVPFDIEIPGDGLLRAMSIGFLVENEKALAWRGPMVMGAVRQLINDVDWSGKDGPLDIMLIDTPPGTGDAHLTLIQSSILHGAVIVTTPQQMALADVERGVALFNKTKTPILGLIENMAWLDMPDGSRSYIFGERGGEQIADKLGIAFLGSIPLQPDLRIACDKGEAATQNTEKSCALFDDLAKTLID